MSTTATTLKGQPLNKSALDALLRRRMFFTPSFEIYGPLAGLFDLGPPGAALQSNIIEAWRQHFILEENMLEVDCTVLTPHSVLKTSGHVDKFSDWLCRDPKTGDNLRADHFVRDLLEGRLEHPNGLDPAVVEEYEEILAKLDDYSGEELGELIKKHDLRNPETNLQPEPPVAFNLMFQTSIGPSGNVPAYLRPETAQGQFMNFAKLLEYNMGAMPFASASIGRSYRNEISPRAGLNRVREFLLAEIEHFVDPESGKRHERFHEVEHLEVTLLDRETQLSGQTTVKKVAVGTAVRNGTVDNETLGYFLARICLFAERIGLDMSKTRFRQHMQNEMAHYACDCWDLEVLTSTGWVECVGCADRSAYDLAVHGNFTGKPLVVRENLEQPRAVEEWVIEIDRKKFGPYYKGKSKLTESALIATSQNHRETLAKELKEAGKIMVDVPSLGNIEVTKDFITIERRTKTENVREYIPNVIEPSFGIGRLLSAVCEHNFWTRADDGGDEARCILSFPPAMAPTKVLIVPLSSNKDFTPHINKLSRSLRAARISSRIDSSSASIGKRYARNDELGTALAVTVDFQTLDDNTVTIRDRDSMRQVRVDEDDVIEVVEAIVEGRKTWEEVEIELGVFE